MLTEPQSPSAEAQCLPGIGTAVVLVIRLSMILVSTVTDWQILAIVLM